MPSSDPPITAVAEPASHQLLHPGEAQFPELPEPAGAVSPVAPSWRGKGLHAVHGDAPTSLSTGSIPTTAEGSLHGHHQDAAEDPSQDLKRRLSLPSHQGTASRQSQQRSGASPQPRGKSRSNATPSGAASSEQQQQGEDGDPWLHYAGRPGFLGSRTSRAHMFNIGGGAISIKARPSVSPTRGSTASDGSTSSQGTSRARSPGLGGIAADAGAPSAVAGAYPLHQHHHRNGTSAGAAGGSPNAVATPTTAGSSGSGMLHSRGSKGAAGRMGPLMAAAVAEPAVPAPSLAPWPSAAPALKLPDIGLNFRMGFGGASRSPAAAAAAAAAAVRAAALSGHAQLFPQQPSPPLQPHPPPPQQQAPALGRVSPPGVRGAASLMKGPRISADKTFVFTPSSLGDIAWRQAR